MASRSATKVRDSIATDVCFSRNAVRTFISFSYLPPISVDKKLSIVIVIDFQIKTMRPAMARYLYVLRLTPNIAKLINLFMSVMLARLYLT